MSLTIRRHADATGFLARAEAWLLLREADHNLILGIARSLSANPAAYPPPIYLATVEEDDAVVGCAWRTPPFKVGLTAMPEGAAPAVARDAAEVVGTIPAVLGPERQAREFAETWCGIKGGAMHARQHNRIYELRAVAPLYGLPPGRLRGATMLDHPLAARWVQSFVEDTGVAGHPDAAGRWIGQGRLFLWEDGGPVCMAAVVAETPNGVRIGGVFTPRELRGRGYATACVAALSKHVLESGRRFCFLYTDLGNPTSNAIYARIGYVPVCDVVDYEVTTGGDCRSQEPTD